MKTRDGHPQRRSMRLPDRNYAAPGAFFVTMVTHQRVCLFGHVESGAIRLSAAGRIAQACWTAIPEHFPDVRLDAFVVMPNHVHGMLVIGRWDTVSDPRPPGRLDPTKPRTQAPEPGSLGAVIRSFKSATTRQIRELHPARSGPVWQRNYHERVIVDMEARDRIRDYIRLNPVRWVRDRENLSLPDEF